MQTFLSPNRLIIETVPKTRFCLIKSALFSLLLAVSAYKRKDTLCMWSKITMIKNCSADNFVIGEFGYIRLKMEGYFWAKNGGGFIWGF